MFSSKVTKTVGLMMMMMMMVMVAEAAPKPGGQSKHLAKKNKRSSETMETVPLELNLTSLALTQNIRPLENVSISPWMNNFSSDASLFLPFSEAHCLLRGCLDSEGVEDLSLESKPIKRQMLLLKRVASKEGAEHRYHFRLETRVVAVGCTCIRPVVLRQ